MKEGEYRALLKAKMVKKYHHNAEMCPSLEQNPINHRFANLPQKAGPLAKAYFKNWV